MMRWITLLMLFACVGFLGPELRSDGTPPAPSGAVSRFQISEGVLPLLNDKNGKRTVFRIDTFTGQTWVLQAVPIRAERGDSTQVNTWLDIEETDSEIYRIAYLTMEPAETRQARLQAAKDREAWCLANREGGTLQVGGRAVVLTKEMIEESLRTVRATIEEIRGVEKNRQSGK